MDKQEQTNTQVSPVTYNVEQSPGSVTINIPQSDNIANPQALPSRLCTHCNESFWTDSDIDKHLQIINQQDHPNEAPQDVQKEDPGASIKPELKNVDNIAKTEDLSTIEEGVVVEQKPKHAGGRPTKYNKEMYQKAKDYYYSCLEGQLVTTKEGKQVRRPKMPLIEELARLCDVDHETLENWTNYDDEFLALYKKIKSHQRESLINRGFQMKNPTFAIFLLKAQHGMMESEKRILSGEKDSDPIQLNTVSYKDSANQLPTPIQQAVIEEGTE